MSLPVKVKVEPDWTDDPDQSGTAADTQFVKVEPDLADNTDQAGTTTNTHSVAQTRSGTSNCSQIQHALSSRSSPSSSPSTEVTRRVRVTPGLGAGCIAVPAKDLQRLQMSVGTLKGAAAAVRPTVTPTPVCLVMSRPQSCKVCKCISLKKPTCSVKTQTTLVATVQVPVVNQQPQRIVYLAQPQKPPASKLSTRSTTTQTECSILGRNWEHQRSEKSSPEGASQTTSREPIVVYTINVQRKHGQDSGEMPASSAQTQTAYSTKNQTSQTLRTTTKCIHTQTICQTEDHEARGLKDLESVSCEPTKAKSDQDVSTARRTANTVSCSTQREEPDYSDSCIQTAIHLLQARPHFASVQYELRELGQPVLQMRRGDLYGLQGWPGDPVICTLTPDGVLTHRVIYLPPRVVHVTSDGRTLHADLFLREMRWLTGLTSFCLGIDKQCALTSATMRDVQVLDYPEPRMQSVNCTVMLDTPKYHCVHCRRWTRLNRKTTGRGRLQASAAADDQNTQKPPSSERLAESPPSAKKHTHKLRSSKRLAKSPPSAKKLTHKLHSSETLAESPPLTKKPKTKGDLAASRAMTSDALGRVLPRSGDSERTAGPAAAAPPEGPAEGEKRNRSPAMRPGMTASRDEPVQSDDLVAQEEEAQEDALPLEMSCDTVDDESADGESAGTRGSSSRKPGDRSHAPHNPAPRPQTTVVFTRAHNPDLRAAQTESKQGENSAPTSVAPDTAPLPENLPHFKVLHPDHPDILSLRNNRAGATWRVGILNSFRLPGHKPAASQTRSLLSPPGSSESSQCQAVPGKEVKSDRR